MAAKYRNLATLLGGVLLNVAALSAGAAAFAQEDCQPPPPPVPDRVDIAVSLKRLEAELRRCQPSASCSQETLTWYGMTHVTGYVVDPASHDIELFGTTESAAAPLQVADFSVAARNAVHKYAERRGSVMVYADPAVSIDPDPVVLRRLNQIMAGQAGGAVLESRLRAWCTTCELPQAVRVMGIGADADTHFGYTMFAADLLMKGISNGTVPVTGLDSLADLALQMAIAGVMHHSSGNAQRAELNRFWFLSGTTSYLEDSNTAVLARADVILRTEAEQVSGRGISGSGRTDPLAEHFACAFSRIYPQLTTADSRYPVYAELESLFRWVAIARVLAGGGAFEAAGYRPDFLIDDFAAPHVAVPRTVKGLAHVSKWDHEETDGNIRSEVSLRLPSCGGVAVGLERSEMAALPDTDQQLPRINAAVISSRPARPASWWSVRM